MNNGDKSDNQNHQDGNMFRFQFADIGATLAWGKPENQGLAKIAYNYQIAPLVNELKAFDVYLVDGRYRVACACISFLHALKYYGEDLKNQRIHDHVDTNIKDVSAAVRKHVQVAIHDATARENSFGKYGQLQSIADIEKKSQELWIYRLKDGVTQEDIYQLWKSNTKIQFRRNRRRRRLDNRDIRHEGNKNDLKTSIISKFDTIQRETYIEAISTPDVLPITDPKSISSDILIEKMKNIWGEHGVQKKDVDILKKIYTNSSSVFEFGLSPLSVMAACTNVTRYSGSDSVASSITSIRKFAMEEKLDHFRFFFSDIGKTDEKGIAVENTLSKVWFDYSVAPLVVENKAFDLYVIDGRRYTFLSTCMSFLHALKHGADMAKVTVIVHDDTSQFEGLKNAKIDSFANLELEGDSFRIYRLLSTSQEEDIIAKLLHNNFL